jgi:Protein of unknown function (DUF2637)
MRGRLTRLLDRLTLAIGVAAVTTAVVALASAILSWDALQWGAKQLGVDPHLAWLYPVAVDGTIVVGTVAALALRRARRRIRMYVWGLLGSAIGASVIGNGAHAAGGGPQVFNFPLHRVGAAVPAAALAASLHLLVILVRTTAADERVTQPAPVSGAESAQARVPARAEVRRLLQRKGARVDADLVAKRTGVSKRHASRLLQEELRPRAIGGEQ